MHGLKILSFCLVCGALTSQSIFDELRKRIKANPAAAKPAPAGEARPKSLKTVGECVLTAEPFDSYESAKGRKVTSIKDGQPVYFHVKFDKQIGSFAGRWYRGSATDVEYADRIGFILEVGPEGEVTKVYDSSIVLLAPKELAGNELHLNLAPGEVRPKPIAAWMDTLGKGLPGVWKNEIRLVTHQKIPGEGMTRWEKVYLAIAPLTADVSDGNDSYRKMASEYRKRVDQGDPSWNEVPAPGALKDSAAIKQVMAIVKREVGGEIGRLHFTVDTWYEQRNALGQLEQDTATAIVTLKSGGKYWARFIDVTRSSHGAISARIRNPQEITKEKY